MSPDLLGRFSRRDLSCGDGRAAVSQIHAPCRAVHPVRRKTATAAQLSHISVRIGQASTKSTSRRRQAGFVGCQLNEEHIATKYGAEILRRHVESSSLSDTRKNELLDATDEILRSSCFTPRLVEQLIGIEEDRDWRPQLKDSSFIWTRPFDHMLQQPGLAELIYVATANIPERDVGCPIATLQCAWQHLMSCSSASASRTSYHVFALLLRTLEGSFLICRKCDFRKSSCAAFYNGSVADFMTGRLMSDPPVLQRLLHSLGTSAQAAFLYRCMVTLQPAPFALQQLARALLHQDVLLGSENDQTWSDFAIIVAAARYAGLWREEDRKLLLESAQDFFVGRWRYINISGDAAAIAMHLLLDHAEAKNPRHDGLHRTLYNRVWSVLANHSNWRLLGTIMQRIYAVQWPIDYQCMQRIASNFERHVEEWWKDESHRKFSSLQFQFDIPSPMPPPPPPAIRHQQQWDELLHLAHTISPRLRVHIHFLFGHRGDFRDNLAPVPTRTISSPPRLPGGPATLIPFAPTMRTNFNNQPVTVPLVRSLWGCADQEDVRFIELHSSYRMRMRRSQSAPELSKPLALSGAAAAVVDSPRIDRSLPAAAVVTSSSMEAFNHQPNGVEMHATPPMQKQKLDAASHCLHISQRSHADEYNIEQKPLSLSVASLAVGSSPVVRSPVSFASGGGSGGAGSSSSSAMFRSPVRGPLFLSGSSSMGEFPMRLSPQQQRGASSPAARSPPRRSADRPIAAADARVHVVSPSVRSHAASAGVAAAAGGTAGTSASGRDRAGKRRRVTLDRVQSIAKPTNNYREEEGNNDEDEKEEMDADDGEVEKPGRRGRVRRHRRDDMSTRLAPSRSTHSATASQPLCSLRPTGIASIPTAFSGSVELEISCLDKKKPCSEYDLECRMQGPRRQQ